MLKVRPLHNFNHIQFKLFDHFVNSTGLKIPAAQPQLTSEMSLG